MEFGQQTLPFKKVVNLANGQVAISLAPIKPSMWSGFVCQLCKLTFKTQQGLAGHKTSVLHKCRMGDQINLDAAASPAITPSAQSSGTSTPVCALVTSSSSTASSSIASTCSRKQRYVRISRAKLTRGANIRKRWSVLSKAEVIEALRKFENSEVDNKKYAVTARLFKVPVGNLSRWWKSREAISKQALGHSATAAEELQIAQALGVQSVLAAGSEISRKVYCRAAEQETSCEFGLCTPGVSTKNC